MVDESDPIALATCTVYNVSACFGDGTEDIDEGDIEDLESSGLSFMPLIAAFWYGLIASASAIGPMVYYLNFKSDSMSTLTRNDIYKYTWTLLRYGNAIVYAPIMLLWPFSYFASPAISNLYLSVEKFFGSLGTLLHLTVLLMFLYARRLYLYESELEYQVVELELVGYFLTTFVIFRMIGW